MADWCEKVEVPPKEAFEPVPISSLCERGWRPLLIRGMLRDVLIRHFSTRLNPAEVEFKDLRRYIWRDSEQSGILIESTDKWKGDNVNRRPAILIGQNARQAVPTVIQNLLGENERGFRDYFKMWAGSHTLFCVHGTSAGVDILATEVEHLFSGFAHEISQYLSLLKFDVTEVGQISKVEESKENFVVPVTVGWAYQDKWAVWDESFTLRRLPLSYVLG